MEAESEEVPAFLREATAPTSPARHPFQSPLRQVTEASSCVCFLGLFNLRGSDVEHNPVFFSYAIIGLETIK